MIAAISLYRFTFVLPVPVTAFSQITDTDINTSATDTIRITGMAAVIKSSP